MTLTLTYIDRLRTIQVADCRISERGVDGQMYPREEDNAIKVVTPKGTLLLSYTGVAELGGDTGTWLEERLNNGVKDLGATVAQVAHELTTIFNGPGFEKRFLTATISGWALNESDELAPTVAAITNRHPGTRSRMVKFKGVAAPMQKDGGWVSTGVSMPEPSRKSLEQYFTKPLPAGVDVAVIVNIFLRAIRRAAEISNGVSKNAMAIIYPAIEAQRVLDSGTDFLMFKKNTQGYILPDTAMCLDIAETIDRVQMVSPSDADFANAEISEL